MNNLKMSHKSPQVITVVIKWIRGIYRDLCIPRGKNHEYLDMDINCSIPGKVTFSMEK